MFNVLFTGILLLWGSFSTPSFAAFSSNRAAILEHNLEAMDARLQLISRARREIALETFYLQPDNAGGTLLKALVTRKQKHPKLQIRILIDAWGSKDIGKELADELQSQGIEIKRYNTAGPINPRRNHRNHRKLLTVDGQFAIIGGRNIANEHFGAKTEYSVLDRELVMDGPIAAELTSSFNDYWNHPYSEEFGEPSAPNSHANIDRLPTLSRSASEWGPGVAWFEVSAELITDPPGLKPGQSPSGARFLEAFTRANAVWLEGTHVIPTDAFAQELNRKGGRVTLYTDSPVAVHPYDYTTYSLSYFRMVEAARAGVRIWGYDGHPGGTENGSAARFGIHTKSYILDNELWIGSYNLDPRSYTTNSELFVRITGGGLRDAVLSNMNRRFANSLLLQPDGHYEGWGDLWEAVPADFIRARSSAKLFRYVLEPYY